MSDFHEILSVFVDELDDDEREEFGPFADSLMEKRGYTKRSEWVPPEPGQRPRLRAAAQQQQQRQQQQRGLHFRGGQQRAQ